MELNHLGTAVALVVKFGQAHWLAADIAGASAAVGG